ncbi:MAG TPA: hypothetical protein VMW87_00470 [Spirochaetia bacterium]|nr:hypothetical protein [Spirochaetia bacterium]
MPRLFRSAAISTCLICVIWSIAGAEPPDHASPGMVVGRQLIYLTTSVRFAASSEMAAGGEWILTGDGSVSTVGSLSNRPGMVTIPGLSPRNRFADVVHVVLGVATVVAGALTGIFRPEVAGYDVHHALGWTSGGLAAASLLSGLWAHAGDVGVSRGLSSANVHATLGIAGGLMMFAAPIVAPTGPRGGEGDDGGIHAALGAGGELFMGAAILWPIVFR